MVETGSLHVHCLLGQVNVPGVRRDRHLRVQLQTHGTNTVGGGPCPSLREAVGARCEARFECVLHHVYTFGPVWSKVGLFQPCGDL